MGTKQPAVARRHGDNRLNQTWRIELFEFRYPGQTWQKIESTRDGAKWTCQKWIYVLHHENTLTLLDEIFAYSDTDWYVYLPAHRGKRLGAKDGASGKFRVERMKPGGYLPPNPSLFNGTFYFYLSPIQLGPLAIKKLIEWTEDEIKRELRGTLEQDFARLKKLADARYARDVKKYGKEKARLKLAWEDLDKESQSLRQGAGWLGRCFPFTATRAAFNFDRSGNRVKAADLGAAQNWDYVVLLQDPKTWAEDLKVYGIEKALDLFKAYAYNEERQLRGFVARCLAEEIAKNKSADLGSELLSVAGGGPLDSSNAAMYARDKKLRERLGWERFKVPPISRKDPRAVGAAVFDSDWLETCKKFGGNAAELYLALDDLHGAAYLEKVDRFAGQLYQYLRGRRHRVMCVEHCHAMLDVPSDGASTAEQLTAIRNMTEGYVHWSMLLDRLSETPVGRQIVTELAEQAAQQQEKDPYFYCIMRGLFPEASPGSSSADQPLWGPDYFKKIWDQTLKRAARSALIVLPATLAGMLDPKFATSARMVSPKHDRVFTWVDKVLSRLMGGSPVPKMGKRNWTKVVGKQVFAEFGRVRNFVDVERELLQSRAKAYSRATPTIGASLTVVDGLYSFFQLYDTLLKQGKDFSAGNVRQCVYALEAARDVLTVVAKAKDQPKWSVLKSLASGKGAWTVGGRLLGMFGTVLDIGVSLKSVGATNNSGLKLGHGLQAAGAAGGLAAGLYAWSVGAALMGPIGLIFAAIYFIGYVSGQIFIWKYSHDSWRKMARGSFLGKEGAGKTGLADLRCQQGWIVQLYSEFEVTLTGEEGPNWPLRVEIKPGLFGRGCSFALTLKTSTGSTYDPPEKFTVRATTNGDLRVDGPEGRSTLLGKSPIAVRLRGFSPEKRQVLNVSMRLHCGEAAVTLPDSKDFETSVVATKIGIKPWQWGDRSAKKVDVYY